MSAVAPKIEIGLEWRNGKPVYVLTCNVAITIQFLPPFDPPAALYVSPGDHMRFAAPAENVRLT